jgi:hypothetical protein
MDVSAMALAPQRLPMDCNSERLRSYIKSATFDIEVDPQDASLYIRQSTATGSARVGLQELFAGIRSEGMNPDQLFIEFVPYNGGTQIVMGDETEVSLTPRDSAMGRALWKAAYVKTSRDIDEEMLTPPPGEVVSIPRKK